MNAPHRSPANSMCMIAGVTAAILSGFTASDPCFAGNFEATSPETPTVALPSGFCLLVPVIPESDRLMPSVVEFELRRLAEDDAGWEAETISVTLLTSVWGDPMRGMGTDFPYMAPVPLTREQALSFLPEAVETSIAGSLRVMSFIGDGEHTLVYIFDEAGRTIGVDWDPVADSGVYVFRYSYLPNPGDEAVESPEWIDPDAAGQFAGIIF